MAKENITKPVLQRSIPSPLLISECSRDGKVIILENTSRNNDISMANWVLRRRVDNKPEITFKFPENFTLKTNKTVRIWAGKHGSENLPTDLVNKDIENWLVAPNSQAFIENDAGEVKVTYQG